MNRTRLSQLSSTGRAAERMQWSLQRKASMITTGVLIVLAALLAMGVESVFREGFGRLERDALEESVRRIRTRHEAELEELERSATDYAGWTDTYEFMADPTRPYVQNNLPLSTFTNLKIDAFLIFDREGELRVGRALREGEVVPASAEGATEALHAQARRVGMAAEASSKGAVMMNGQIALFAMKPILRDDGSGPPRGALAHVRYLHPARVQGMRQALNLDVMLHAVHETGPDEGAVPALAGGAAFASAVVSRDLLLAHVPVPGLDGKPIGIYHLRLPREIHRQGTQARWILYGVIAILVIGTAVLIGRLLRSMVIARLESLHATVQKIGETSNLAVRLPEEGSDEISGLAGGINRMLAALEQGEARRQAAEHERQQLNLHLQQAQKLEAIGTLTGGLAHDFNNLLTSIQGSATLLRLQPDAASSARHLRRIEQAAAQAIGLVRQMTAFGRRTPPAFVHLHLAAVIRDSMELLRSSVPCTIEFHFHNDAGSDVVHADAGQLQQVFVNLGTNSSHAMADGIGTLEVRLSEVTLPDHLRPETAAVPPGSYLRVLVRDTGTGISPEHLPRIFEPFYTTKPVGSGTGLGLAVAHGIVTQHGGVIGIASAVGRGTSVYIHLPKANVPADRPIAEESRATVQRVEGDARRLLLVDDDDLVRETLEAGLRRKGYEVVAASCGTDALVKIREDAGGFDYVVTDQMMPGMTGTELGKIVRRELPKLPLILITGFASALNEPKVKEMGFSAMLMKPVTMDDLDRAIRSSRT